MENLNPNEMISAAGALSSNADSYVNDPVIEYQWAMKAYSHAETYFNILCALDPQYLKLTKFDDRIYEEFRNDFSDFNVQLIDENVLKSNDSKEKWRPFCENYKGVIEDYNFATLIRIDALKDYSEENTCIVPRIQFYAIEIARNREGCNKTIKEEFKQVKSKLIE